MVFVADISIVFMGLKSQLITGGHHLVLKIDIYNEFYPLKMVIYHSYVTLPESTCSKMKQKYIFWHLCTSVIIDFRCLFLVIRHLPLQCTRCSSCEKITSTTSNRPMGSLNIYKESLSWRRNLVAVHCSRTRPKKDKFLADDWGSLTRRFGPNKILVRIKFKLSEVVLIVSSSNAGTRRTAKGV